MGLDPSPPPLGARRKSECFDRSLLNIYWWVSFCIDRSLLTSVSVCKARDGSQKRPINITRDPCKRDVSIGDRITSLPDGYCAAAQGLLDWFEVDRNAHQAFRKRVLDHKNRKHKNSFIDIELCIVCFFLSVFCNTFLFLLDSTIDLDCWISRFGSW